jgi:hypothetical protein
MRTECCQEKREKGAIQLTEQQEWAELLPDDCPPPEAWEPDNNAYFRLIDGYPPTPKDFFSPRKLKPNRNFGSVSECQTHGLSIFNDIDACRDVAKLPGLRHKEVAKVTLPPECGVVLQTGKPAHHSWWLRAAFDPVSICEPL